MVTVLIKVYRIVCSFELKIVKACSYIDGIGPVHSGYFLFYYDNDSLFLPTVILYIFLYIPLVHSFAWKRLKVINTVRGEYLPPPAVLQ